MKISKEKLKSIIKEEINYFIKESNKDIPKGLKSWVAAYIVARNSNNTKLAKDIKKNIDKEIKNKGLNKKDVYLYFGDPDDPKEKKKVLKKAKEFTKEIYEKRLNEQKIDKDTLYIERSSMFDTPPPEYDIDLFKKTLKRSGATEVWVDNAFGWSNQPEVVLFNGISKRKAEKALSNLPMFKEKTPIISKAHNDWR